MSIQFGAKFQVEPTGVTDAKGRFAFVPLGCMGYSASSPGEIKRNKPTEKEAISIDGTDLQGQERDVFRGIKGGVEVWVKPSESENGNFFARLKLNPLETIKKAFTNWQESISLSPTGDADVEVSQHYDVQSERNEVSGGQSRPVRGDVYNYEKQPGGFQGAVYIDPKSKQDGKPPIYIAVTGHEYQLYKDGFLGDDMEPARRQLEKSFQLESST